MTTMSGVTQNTETIDEGPFREVKEQFGENLGSQLADKLASIHTKLCDAGADAAARRLRRLDENVSKESVAGLLRLLDPERIVDEFAETCQRNARRWHLGRNLAALVPLFLTWYALFWATLAYQQELAIDPRLVVRPFLDLWEQRFGGHLFFFGPTFSQTAMLDSALVLSIIVVTIFAHRADQHARYRALAFEAELDDAVAVISGALADARILPHSSPQDWATAVRKVIEEAMAQTKVLARTNQQAVQRAVAVIAKVETGADDLLRDLSKQAGDAMRSSQAQHLQLIAHARDEIDGILQAASQAHREIATLNRDAAESAKVAMQAARGDIQVFIDQLAQEIRQTLVIIKDDNASFIRDTAKVAESVLTDASSVFRGDIVPLVQELGSTLRGLNQEMKQYQASASTFAATVTDLGTAASTLAATSRESATIIQSIDNHLQSANQTQQAYATQIAGAAQDMRTTSVQVQSLADRLGGDVATHIQAIMTDAQAVSVELRHAGTGLHHLQQQLDATTRALNAAADRLGSIQRNPRWWPF